MDIYPDNTLANFKVKLGRPLELSGTYEVALVEIIYPNKSFNVQGDEASVHLSKEKTTRIELPKLPENDVGSEPKKTEVGASAEEKKKVKTKLNEWKEKKKAYERKVRNHKKQLISQVGQLKAKQMIKKGIIPKHYDKVQEDSWTIGLEPGLYTSVGELHSKLSHRLKKQQNDVLVGLDRGIFTIKLIQGDGWIRKVHLSPRMAELLGYPATDKGYTLTTSGRAPMLPQLEGNAHSLYIYSSVVENQLVGDTIAPLLRVVCPVSDKMGEKISEKYIRPYYVPVYANYIDTIDITIRTTTGHLYPFLSGDPVILNLHFRPRL